MTRSYIGFTGCCIFISVAALCSETARSQAPSVSSSSEPRKSTNKGGRSTRKAPKKNPGLTMPSNEMAASESDVVKEEGDGPKSAITSELGPAASRPKVPSWLIDFRMNTTPRAMYEISCTSASLEAGKVTSNRKTSGQTITKDRMAIDLAVLNLNHQFITTSKKIFWQVGAQTVQTFSRGRITSTAGGNASYEMTGTSPQVLAGFGTQPMSGLWVGLEQTWQKNTEKIEFFDVVLPETKKVSHDEESAQVVGIEYRSVPVQIGLEYQVENDSDGSTSTWMLPIRVAMTDKVFIGAAMGGGETAAYSTSTQKSNATYGLEFGVQGAASAYVISFDHGVKKGSKSGEVSVQKENALTLGAIFGSPQGFRFYAEANYYKAMERAGSTEESKAEGGSFGFGIALVR